MASVIDRLKKRAFYPFKLVNGETVHLRALKYSQLKLINEHLEGKFRHEEASVGYVIGNCLLEDTGEEAFAIAEQETAAEFGLRVLESIDLTTDVKDEIIDAIWKISTDPKEKAHEAIVKN